MTVYAVTSPGPARPYLSLDEYKRSPTSVETDNLVAGGSAADNDAELEQIILRASSWMDQEADVTLAAAAVTETRKVRANRQGEIIVHPDEHPVRSLTAVSYGHRANSMAVITDLSAVYLEPAQITIPLIPYPTGAAVELSGPRPGQRLILTYTYTAGWPVTTLDGAASALDTQVTLADVSGIIPGLTSLTIRDGTSSETRTVTDVTGSTVTLAALTYDHADGTPVDDLPGDLKQACVYVTTGFLKSRSIGNLSIGSTTPTSSVRDPERAHFGYAREILSNYGRVR